MKRCCTIGIVLLLAAGACTAAHAAGDGHGAPGAGADFPLPLDRYGDAEMAGILEMLSHRVVQEPFNLVATLIFLCAIVHTFLTARFRALAHRLEHAHEHKKKEGKVRADSVHLGAEVMHFLGEVEVTFGLWAFALFGAITAYFDWSTVVDYLSLRVNYTEPMFVVVIMLLASTRPVLKLAEAVLQRIANLFGGTLGAWWLTILTFGPILGSFITEPAAMTISALLIADKFYELQPDEKFKYATIGLLFVNISVGGTFTHFAAPPVLMVSGSWGWDLPFMIVNFGWKAVVGILISNGLYFYLFRREMRQLQEQYAIVQIKQFIQERYIREEDLDTEFDKMEQVINEELGFADACDGKLEEIKGALKTGILANVSARNVDQALLERAFDERFEEVRLQEMRRSLPGLLPADQRPDYYDPEWNNRRDRVPAWVMVIHLFFMGWTVLHAHSPALFVAGLLFFLGFAQVTSQYQNRIYIQPALLVGFFLAGLVIHGGLQGWWIAPVLGNLTELPLMIGATVLTAFNDNAAITYLSTLVPDFMPSLKYAVVAGAVTGGGLTVIANAPNPAGQSLLSRYFDNGVSPIGLVRWALIPTVVMGGCFLLLP